METVSRFFQNILVAMCFFTIYAVNGYAQNRQPQILWDNYGVPHIYSETTAGMYYAFGWATMHNHANLVLQLYGQARGRAAEYWGSQFLQGDELIQKFDVPRIAKGIYFRQNPQYKSYLDAFVKGENDYCKKHPEAVAEKYRQVLPLTPQDVISHTIQVFSIDFVAIDNIYGALSDANDRPGSNAMAIAPSRSSSHHALLLTNPHLPWGGVATFFEAHLNAPGFNAYGVTFVGIPVLVIAFNKNLGWTHTVNPINASTRYELTLKDKGYLLDGSVVPFKTKTVTIKIRQDDSTMKREALICKYASQGPVVAENKKHAYAVRIAGLNNAFLYEQYHKMAMASNLKEFEAAEKMLQMPMFNTTYADKAGNIMYLYGGNVPIVKRGDFWFWHGKVDGALSSNTWTKTLPYSALPKLINPTTGFVQNSNDVPWTCTFPTVLNPDNYPPYLVPATQFTKDFREQRAFDMIKNNHAITFDQLIDDKLNTGLETAYKLLNDLLIAADKDTDGIVIKAVKVLKEWDRHTDTISKGAILFIQWYTDMNADSIFKYPWNFKQAATTPSGLKYPAYAVNILKQAAAELLSQYGALDMAWGDVYRFRGNGIDLPANGAPAEFGSYRAISYRKDKDKKYRAVGGDTYAAITEFGKTVKAFVVLNRGNASQPGSKHISDQLILMSAKKMRQALLTKAEVLQHLEETENLNY